MLKEGAKWSYFAAWYGHYVDDNKQTTRERLKELFAHPYVMCIDELPDLRTYPHKTVGPPARLSFINKFPLIMTESLSGQDIAVAIHDTAGRTVRDVWCKVTLELLPDGPVEGETSLYTVNGVARFEGLKILQSRRNLIFKATTRSLDKIESPRFEVRNGGIYREWYLDVRGYNVFDLSRSWKFPDFPSGSDTLRDIFETGALGKENYGQRFRGRIIAPVTGDYVFWISADDKGDLYLSSDESPKNKKMICRVAGYSSYRVWDKEPNQKSVPIHLQRGQRYYIEALHKQASGGEHLSVGWTLPNGVNERPIPAFHIEPFDPKEDKPAAR
jgi:hypothetical protein